MISLGNPDIPKEYWKEIANLVDGRLYQRPKLFELFPPEGDREEIQEWADTIVRRIELQGKWQSLSAYRKQKEPGKEPEKKGPESANPVQAEPVPDVHPESVIDGVLIDRVSHQSTAMLGPVLVDLSAWNQLDTDGCLKNLGVSEPWIKSALVSIINRLTDPVSEHRLPQWVASTALPELLEDDLLQSGKDRYYRASDTLLSHRDAITRHLRRKTQELFSLERTICLYDLTNTYFEGEAGKNPKAKRGKSKEKRNDCPQIVVGMVLDENGFELAHKVYEGNRSDSTTVPDMVRQLKEMVMDNPEDLSSQVLPTVIMDGGLSGSDNLQAVREAGFHYLVNDSRRGRKRHRDAFREKEGFSEVTGRGKRVTPVWVKPLTDPETGDQLLLCHSDQRGEKEKAMLSRVVLIT